MKTIEELDSLGIRCFVTYAEQNGKWGVVVYTKKDSDWKMVRNGHIGSYSTRQEAEEVVVKFGNELFNKQYDIPQ